MAIPVMTFQDPLLRQPLQPSPLQTALQGAQQGIGLGQQFQKLRLAAALAPFQEALMKAQAQQAPLRTQLLQGQVQQLPLQEQLLKLKPAIAQAQIDLMHSQARKAAAQAAQPGAGATLPGAAGRAMGLQMIANKYGEDSPIFKRALKDYNADVQLKLSRADYFSSNVALKNLPTINKMQAIENFQNEQSQRVAHGLPKQTFNEWYKSDHVSQDEKTGLAPHHSISSQSIVTGTPVTTSTPTMAESIEGGTTHIQPTQAAAPAMPPPMSQAAVTPTTSSFTQEPFGIEAKQTGLGIVGQTVPTFIRQKLAFATNIEKTLGNMPEQAILSYSERPDRLIKDYKLSLQGKVTPDYSKYLTYVTNAKILAGQIRQFYGDSITPAGMKRLEELSNPISWRTNPKAALTKFRALKNTLGREIQTYRSMATQPSATQPYTPTGATAPLPALRPSPAPERAAPTQEDLEYTAKLHNMTVAQVKQRLGIQ